MTFADAFDDLFADPNMAVTVTYQGRPVRAGAQSTNDGIAVVRALVRRPDRDLEFSDITVHTATALFEIRRRDVPEPRAGDIITHDGGSFVVQGEPRLDAERLVWTLNVRPA